MCYLSTYKQSRKALEGKGIRQWESGRMFSFVFGFNWDSNVFEVDVQDKCWAEVLVITVVVI